MPHRKSKETIDLTGWLAPWEADVLRKRIDDLRDLLKRIRNVVHDALPDKTDPLELDAAIELALRENVELGKRYDELAKMVDRRMGELEAENERLREQVTPVLFSEREPEDATEILIWNRISYRWEYRMWWHLPDDVCQYQGLTYWLPEPPPPDDSLVVV